MSSTIKLAAWITSTMADSQRGGLPVPPARR